MTLLKYGSLIFVVLGHRFTLSAVIYVLERCRHSLCGIIHRKTHYTNKYSTPLIFMNNKGRLQGVSGQLPTRTIPHHVDIGTDE